MGCHSCRFMQTVVSFSHIPFPGLIPVYYYLNSIFPLLLASLPSRYNLQGSSIDYNLPFTENAAGFSARAVWYLRVQDILTSKMKLSSDENYVQFSKSYVVPYVVYWGN